MRIGTDIFFDADSESHHMTEGGVIGKNCSHRGHVTSARQIGARTLIARSAVKVIFSTLILVDAHVGLVRKRIRVIAHENYPAAIMLDHD